MRHEKRFWNNRIDAIRLDDRRRVSLIPAALMGYHRSNLLGCTMIGEFRLDVEWLKLQTICKLPSQQPLKCSQGPRSTFHESQGTKVCASG